MLGKGYRQSTSEYCQDKGWMSLVEKVERKEVQSRIQKERL
jgi:hypothetical protein